eukprot:g5681.t1
MRILSVGFVFLLVSVLDTITCQIHPALLRVIEQKEATVQSLAEEVVTLFERRAFYLRNCQCSRHSCTNDVRDFECTDVLGTDTAVCGVNCKDRQILFNSSLFRTPPNINIRKLSAKLKESICVFSNLESTMKELLTDVNPSWLYFGGVDGSFRIYPGLARQRGVENGDPLLGHCRPYDPRIRPWFIGATTRPKDIVLIIDSSHSMDALVIEGGLETRWDVTKRAVFAILDTLSTFDYVSIVAFSDSATRLSQETPLLQARTDEVEFLKEQLDGLSPWGPTNFDAAFSEAFDVLTEACGGRKRTCSGCQKVILFLTDGRDTSVDRGDSISATVMLDKIESYQKRLETATSSRAKIFTFSMGATADDSIPRQIACRNNGSWSFIGEDTDPLTAMAGYYHFLTNPLNSDAPIWINPYEDDGGLGTLTTVARPVYSRGTKELDGVFLGVVGYDVFLRDLEIPGVPWSDLLEALQMRSRLCNVSPQSPCQLQVHRNAYANEALCVDPISTDCSTPSRRSPRTISCFQFSRKFYKLIPTESTWNQAARFCRRDGGSLVVVESSEELAFVAGVSSPDGSWVSAKMNKKSFDFEWTNGRALFSNSSYWGIGEPNDYGGNEDCVHIDQRGISGNLNDENCESKLSFICQYNNSKSCGRMTRLPRGQNYCSVPPLTECAHEEDSIIYAQPHVLAKQLSSRDVMCPLGRSKDSFATRCCPDCKRPRG